MTKLSCNFIDLFSLIFFCENFYYLLEFDYFYCQFLFGNGISDNHHFSFVVLKLFQRRTELHFNFPSQILFRGSIDFQPCLLYTFSCNACFILSVATRVGCVNVVSSVLAMISVQMYLNNFFNAQFFALRYFSSFTAPLIWQQWFPGWVQ